MALIEIESKEVYIVTTDAYKFQDGFSRYIEWETESVILHCMLQHKC
mgnify:CR=1 FL=1